MLLPPRPLTRWIRLLPSLVIAAGRPASNFLFFLWIARRPPLGRRLYLDARQIAALRQMRDSGKDRSHGSVTTSPVLTHLCLLDGLITRKQQSQDSRSILCKTTEIS